MGYNEDSLEGWTVLCFQQYSLGYFWKKSYEKTTTYTIILEKPQIPTETMLTGLPGH